MDDVKLTEALMADLYKMLRRQLEDDDHILLWNTVKHVEKAIKSYDIYLQK